MDREQFYRQLAGMDEQRLKKALWTLYWRGNAFVRERIEAELAPKDLGTLRAASPKVDPQKVLAEVRHFATLARAGAYLAGDRRVSPKERTRWRFTFRRLVANAQDALRAEGQQDGRAALTLLIDLACESRSYDYFRSQDPSSSGWCSTFRPPDRTALAKHARELPDIGFGRPTRSACMRHPTSSMS